MSAAERATPLAPLALLAGLALGTAAFAAEIVSGLAIGAPTASIPVLDVTGPYRGQRICYVCEFQDAPNVLGFFRDTSADTAQLIVALNDLYVRNKDAGFKAVAMIVAGPDAAPWLAQLNAETPLDIPLTVFHKGPADVAARLYELSPEVANTFLVTRDRYVVDNIADIGPDDFARVAAATAAMLAAPGR